VLDASVLINLLGSGEAAAILAGVGHVSLVEQRTLREVLRHPIHGLQLLPALEDLKHRDLLQEVRMTDEEYETYLQLVSGPLGGRLGVGESAAIAISTRAACLILDDRKARRTASEHPTAPAVVSTLRLVLSSAARQRWPLARARASVSSARRHAKMGVLREELPLLAELLGEDKQI
jgi:predicted nucleic acid-binding protein